METGKIKPCRGRWSWAGVGGVGPGSVELGCGAGNYAVCLAGKGFDMTGIDVSPMRCGALQSRAGLTCEFPVADLTGDFEVDRRFSFAYDRELLHHIFPEKRGRYVKNV